MGRTLSAKQVLTLKRRTIRLGGIWDDCVGEIDRTGIMATEVLRMGISGHQGRSADTLLPNGGPFLTVQK